MPVRWGVRLGLPPQAIHAGPFGVKTEAKEGENRLDGSGDWADDRRYNVTNSQPGGPNRRSVMPQSLAALYCHVVFSTKNREPLIDAELEPRLYAYVGGILEARKCALLESGGM